MNKGFDMFVQFAISRTWISSFDDWEVLFPISQTLLFAWLNSIASFEHSNVKSASDLIEYLSDIESMQTNHYADDLVFSLDATRDKVNETLHRLEMMADSELLPIPPRARIEEDQNEVCTLSHERQENVDENEIAELLIFFQLDEMNISEGPDGKMLFS